MTYVQVGQIASFAVNGLIDYRQLSVLVTGNPSDLFEAHTYLKLYSDIKMNEVPLSINEKSDGSLLVEFQPVIIGEHLVQIKLSGHHVPGSPFKCQAYDIHKVKVHSPKEIAFLNQEIAYESKSLRHWVSFIYLHMWIFFISWHRRGWCRWQPRGIRQQRYSGLWSEAHHQKPFLGFVCAKNGFHILRGYCIQWTKSAKQSVSCNGCSAYAIGRLNQTIVEHQNTGDIQSEHHQFVWDFHQKSSVSQRRSICVNHRSNESSYCQSFSWRIIESISNLLLW